uniref:clathrin heavy chain linker domain-containing protein 1 isoform X2 n=1 Tax=Maylandia zebra TaxID=106582 RepID=UPI00032A3208|nr:clathrin heavy chain linker domain-containing protein 1 isoform X2 [Maylandia zebra]
MSRSSRFTADILTTDSDRSFIRSLNEFMEHEKKCLQCPGEGPDELRYTVHRSVFSKVIGRATAYKRLLLAVKSEYDSTIRELQRREEEARAARLTMAASESRRKSLLTCERQAAHLRERISTLQRETAELQEELEREKTSKEQSTWMPGTDEDICSIKQLFEDQEPAGADASELVSDYLDRFLELFELAQYEDAALIAARAPRGVLRNIDTMEMFKGVEVLPGSLSPSFLFFWALLFTAGADGELSAPLSLQGVSCALQSGALQLVSYAVTHKKLTFTEELGDILTEHAQENPGVADLCLTLATIIYEACRLHRKAALSMCRRGLIHSAAEFLKHCEDLTAGALEEVIVGDVGSSVDVWTHVVSLCSELERDDLSRAILSVLLSQSGTRIVTPDPEGARLMEHVYL